MLLKEEETVKKGRVTCVVCGGRQAVRYRSEKDEGISVSGLRMRRRPPRYTQSRSSAASDV